jgi:uncharacterized protein YecE (DUF72 family)
MLYVGTPELRGDISRYQESFNLLELLAVRGRLPRAPTLRRWLTSVGPEFVFATRLPRQLFSRPEAEQREMLAYAGELNEILKARFSVLSTPAQVTPAPRNRALVSRILGELSSTGTRACWEPSGVWEDAEAETLAGDCGALLVRDVSRDPAPAGPTVYTRVLRLGRGSRVGAGTAAALLEATEAAEDVYVVIEGDGAKQVARLLQAEP